MLLIIVGFTEAGSGWNSPKVYILIPLGGAIIIGVTVYEICYIETYQHRYQSSSESRSRLLVLFAAELNNVRMFVISCFGSFFHYCAYTCTQLALVAYHRYCDYDNPLIAALRIFPIVVGIVCGSLIWRPAFVKKVEDRLLIMISVLICLGGSVGASFFRPGGYWRYELVSLLLLGASTNVFYQIVYTTILVKVPLHLQANGSGIFQTFGQVGIALGSAATASIVGGEQTELDESVKKCFYLIFACYAMVITMYGTHLMLSKGERTQDHEMQLDGQPLSGSSLK